MRAAKFTARLEKKVAQHGQATISPIVR